MDHFRLITKGHSYSKGAALADDHVIDPRPPQLLPTNPPGPDSES